MDLTIIAQQQCFSLQDTETQKIGAYAKERYLSYIFLKQSASTGNKLRKKLSDDCTTGENKYPVITQATLHYLDNHSKSIVSTPTAPEGTSFYQRGVDGYGRYKYTFDNEYRIDKECYKYSEKGNPT